MLPNLPAAIATMKFSLRQAMMGIAIIDATKQIKWQKSARYSKRR
jgi:hypothetical protein